MNYLNLIVNVIEAFIFPIFISYIFSLSNKKIYIILSGFIQLFFLQLGVIIKDSGVWLSICIVLINIISLWIAKKHISFNDIYIIVIYNALIVDTSYFGLMIKNFCLDITNINGLSFEIQFIIAVCIAKFILIILTLIIVRYKHKLMTSFSIKKWNIILLYIFVHILSNVYCLHLVVMSSINDKPLLIMLFFNIISFILIIFVFYKISVLNEQRMSYEKLCQQIEINKHELATIKDIKNEMEALDHKLFYIIYKIGYYLDHNEYDKIERLILKYKKIVTKDKLTIYTDNYVFDYLMSIKINELLINEVDIYTSILISKNSFYNNFNLINNINIIFSMLTNCKYIQFSMHEKDCFVICHFLFRDGKVDVLSLEKYISDFCNEFNGKYNINDIYVNGIKIILKVQDESYN